MLPFADVDSKVRLEFGAIELGPTSSCVPEAQRLEFGSSSGELNSARPRVNVTEAYVTLTLRARRNTQLLAQALSVT